MNVINCHHHTYLNFQPTYLNFQPMKADNNGDWELPIINQSDISHALSYEINTSISISTAESFRCIKRDCVWFLALTIQLFLWREIRCHRSRSCGNLIQFVYRNQRGINVLLALAHKQRLHECHCRYTYLIVGFRRKNKTSQPFFLYCLHTYIEKCHPQSTAELSKNT